MNMALIKAAIIVVFLNPNVKRLVGLTFESRYPPHATNNANESPALCRASEIRVTELEIIP
jgi:hypothetical protein